MRDYVATQKLGHAYNIAHLSRKYNGTQISNQQFYNLFIPGYKQHILSHAIVKNADDKFITFSSTKLPFKESKADKLLYTNCQKLNKAFLPIEDDYQSWFDAIDFTIFTDQKYTYEQFAKEIELKENIHTMGESSIDIISWLYSCAEYFKTCDPFIFSKRKLLPNQTGKLQFALQTDKCPVLGPINAKAYVMINGKREIDSNYEISIAANIKEDFSKLTVEERQQAPIVEVTREINLGTIAKGKKVAQKLTVSNVGINPLIVRRVIVSDQQVHVTEPKSAIKAGRKADLKLEVVVNADTAPAQYSRVITLITNDPQTPVINIKLSWIVE